MNTPYHLFIHVLTPQLLVPIKDAVGGTIKTWNDEATFKARVCELDSSENEAFGCVRDARLAQVICGPNPPIESGMRVLYQGNQWELISAPVNRDGMLVVTTFNMIYKLGT